MSSERMATPAEFICMMVVEQRDDVTPVMCGLRATGAFVIRTGDGSYLVAVCEAHRVPRLVQDEEE